MPSSLASGLVWVGPLPLWQLAENYDPYGMMGPNFGPRWWNLWMRGSWRSLLTTPLKTYWCLLATIQLCNLLKHNAVHMSKYSCTYRPYIIGLYMALCIQGFIRVAKCRARGEALLPYVSHPTTHPHDPTPLCPTCQTRPDPSTHPHKCVCSN